MDLEVKSIRTRGSLMLSCKIDGVPVTLAQASETITRCTDKRSNGIFTRSGVFTLHYGEYSKMFDDLPDLYCTNAAVFKELLMERILQVKHWTEGLDKKDARNTWTTTITV